MGQPVQSGLCVMIEGNSGAVNANRIERGPLRPSGVEGEGRCSGGVPCYEVIPEMNLHEIRTRRKGREKIF